MKTAKSILNFKCPLCLVVFALILSGCKLISDSNEQATGPVGMPEIQSKYDEQMRNDFHNKVMLGEANTYEGLAISKKPILEKPDNLPLRLFYDSGIHIAYPAEGVKGLYLTATNVANTEYFDYIIDYINRTELNTVVIDFKDDWGHIITEVDTDNPLIQENTVPMVDMPAVLKRLEANGIYPIARIVTFKDNLLSDLRPDLSFHDKTTGELWADGEQSQFINPFMHETWDYILQISEAAAKMGFKDIQYDYVRFPEGFQAFASDLDYNIGNFQAYVSEDPENEGYERVAAINEFLSYAYDRLMPYGVNVSADVFGYTAIAGDSPDVRGIGQNFAQMAERVDVISSMIYPSHWSLGFFDIPLPDYEPYRVVDNYITFERNILANAKNSVYSRPWLQDFTYSFDRSLFQEYGPQQVQEQINALAANGVYEFLLWNASGEYTEGVDYAPELTPEGQAGLESTAEYNY